MAKKTWKWVLALSAFPVLCIGILWIDSYSRAVAAIRAENERLAKDLAAFRARQKPGLPIDPAIEVKSLPAPTTLFRNPRRPRIEDGHSGHSDFRDGAWGPLFWLEEPDTPRVCGKDILTVISLAHQLLWECGYDSASMLHGYEKSALRELPEALSAMTTDEVRRFAADLDRCLASRQPFADSMEAERLMDRAEVLRVLQLRDNSSGFIARPPGWREFFSWRIHLVQALKELDRGERGRTTSAVAGGLPSALESDREALMYWTAGRTAVAIVLYRADHGGDPERLSDLPRNPALEPGGDRLSFKDGILTLQDDDGEIVRWVLRPK